MKEIEFNKYWVNSLPFQGFATVTKIVPNKVGTYDVEFITDCNFVGVVDSDYVLFPKPTHPEMVAKLKKSGEDILASMNGERMDCLHMSSKLCSEAGELVDAVGKMCFYDRILDRENVIEELGDLEFYMEGLRQRLNITREETIEANIVKLSIRYGDKYSNEAAHARKDKA